MSLRMALSHAQQELEQHLVVKDQKEKELQDMHCRLEELGKQQQQDQIAAHVQIQNLVQIVDALKLELHERNTVSADFLALSNELVSVQALRHSESGIMF